MLQVCARSDSFTSDLQFGLSCTEIVLEYSFSFYFHTNIFMELCFNPCYPFTPCAAAEGQMDCLLLLVNQDHSVDIIDSPDTKGQ